MIVFIWFNNFRVWDGEGGVQNYNIKYFFENLSLNGYILWICGGRIILKSVINSLYILFKQF